MLLTTLTTRWQVNTGVVVQGKSKDHADEIDSAPVALEPIIPTKSRQKIWSINQVDLSDVASIPKVEITVNGQIVRRCQSPF